MKNEPVLTVGTVTAAVAAVLGLLVAFGVDLSADKQTAVLVVVTALAPLVAAVVARGKVTPVSPITDNGAHREAGAIGLGDAVVIGILVLLVLIVVGLVPVR